MVQNTTMTLISRGCTETTVLATGICQPCQSLAKNENLKKIISQIKDGIHEKASFTYHGFSSLHKVLQRKNHQIEFHRLRGLNRAKQLLGKASTLSEHKRMLMAIASGKTKRIDRIISIGLHQKKGIRGLLALVIAAGHGHYHPRSYTEEEAMNALLTWRLAGNRVAEINHRSNAKPSVSYLRSRSIVPQIMPSHAQPTQVEVKQNIMASLESIMDQIHELTQGKVLHTVLMFNELATEKRIRWDPKTNYFLGVCRQHAHRTSMEFVNEGDLEELFRHLNSEIDEEKVHFAGEVRIWFRLEFCFQFPLINDLFLGNSQHS